MSEERKRSKEWLNLIDEVSKIYKIWLSGDFDLVETLLIGLDYYYTKEFIVMVCKNGQKKLESFYYETSKIKFRRLSSKKFKETSFEEKIILSKKYKEFELVV